jgi:Mn2+/Fe2+ NRAMP family transporter
MAINQFLEQERHLLLAAQGKGRGKILNTYFKLSGPGWLQGALTLGGGSLSSSLYLGVLVGFSFMWLQPLAMIFGIIMLSAIGYVTLSTGQRPLQAINEHVSPVLGWGWLIASMMANIVWSMPQYSLATAAIQQNLLQGVVGTDFMPDPWGKILAVSLILTICVIAIILYNFGGRGVKLFEIIVKIMVGSIVISFIGVVIKMTARGGLDWQAIIQGLIPNFTYLSEPVEAFRQHIAAVDTKFQSFWQNYIVTRQRDVMISAAATAVGINMTFLLPYSMLRKGWDKNFRGLAIFDLSLGLFVPFILATSCVVIAAASQFHAVPAAGLFENNQVSTEVSKPTANLKVPYRNLLISRLQYEMEKKNINELADSEIDNKINALPLADKRMAAMLVTRDAFNLADSLAPLTGKIISQYIFGIGILGMAISTAIMVMLINGLCFCEMLNLPARGWPQLVGSLIPAIGALGPFFWNEAKLWLAVPTSVFGMTLLPIAYFSFYLLMNRKKLLGDNLPRGHRRLIWNILMAISASAATFGSIWSLWSKLHWLGICIMGVFILAVLLVPKSRHKLGRE